MVCVNSVSVSPKEVVIKQGEWFCDAIAEVCPPNATCSEVKWRSRHASVAEVNEETGYIYAQPDAEGTTRIYAEATDGSGQRDYITVTVEEETDVTIDNLYEVNRAMYVGDTITLSAEVTPARVADLGVTWMVTNSSVVSIVDVDEVNKTVTVSALKTGNAVVVATARDGREMSACCAITVLEVTPVESITVTPSVKTMDIGTTFKLSKKVLPTNASNRSVTWRSEKNSIAEVAADGTVTAKKEGTVNIYARTVNGGYTAGCTVTVIDPDKKVIVTKDDDAHFSVQFPYPSERVWKSIGCDLSLDENRSGEPLDQAAAGAELNQNELRYLFNKEQNFTVNEIAFLYRLDPLGIEFYMRTDACKDKSDPLGFKDDVYIAIFGYKPGWFRFRPDANGSPVYSDYTGADRDSYFTNAEVMFGFHKYFDWSNFWKDVLIGGFSSIPGISTIQLGVDIYQALFFSGSFVGICSNKATEYVEDYVSNAIEYSVEKKIGERATKAVSWVANLLVLAVDSALDNFIIPNSNDITIYHEIKAQSNYSAVFKIGESEVSMQDFITRCSAN